MVQQNPLQQGNFYSPRDWSRNERSFENLPPPQDDRFSTVAPPSVHSRELSVEDALRDCARIPVKDFALVVLTDSGEERIYLSRALASSQPKIFTDRFRQDFRRCARRAAEGQYAGSAHSQDGMSSEFGSGSSLEIRIRSSSEAVHRPNSRKNRSDDSDDDRSSNAQLSRKRPRYPYRDRSNDEANPIPVQKTQQLLIGDSTEVEKFYFCRFKDMQQSSCKVMGKCFVKLVEPKKQTHHPYTKGDEQAPPWWPNTEGENRVRHREPDHLLKPERIQLLVHILKMIIEPRDRQCLTVQKLGLNVKKLEEVTMEAMSTWFSDKEHPGNEKKRPFLKEIFKVAKAEERFKNGEIDGSTVIPVMYGDRAGMDNSEDDEEDNFRDEEDDGVAPTGSSMPTPESLVSPPIGGPGPHHPQRSESDPNSLHGMRPLPMRHQQMEENSPYSDAGFFPRTTIGFQPPSPTMHDPTRRQFVSPVYHSPQPNLYWQNTMPVSNPTMGGNYYTTTPQSSLPPSTASYQLPPPTTQPMLPPPLATIPTHYDSAMPQSARPYDTSPSINTQLRTGSLGHPHHIPHGYEPYIHDNNSYQQDPNELQESDLKPEHGH